MTTQQTSAAIEGQALHDENRDHLRGDELLKGGSIGVAAIVFMIVATAAPFAGTVSNTALSVALGNGVGTPGTYLVAAIILSLFAVGYTEMSRHITNAGAFFAYVTAGLGARLGTAAGFLALFSYNVLAIYVVGIVGFFAHSVFLSELSIDLPWWLLGLSLLGLALLCGVRGVQLSAGLLGVILAVELSLITIFVVGVVANNGLDTLPSSSFAPSNIFAGGFGVALMFGLLSFLGFEATAIFAEEAKDPRRTVPRATYLAIAVLALFYIGAAWAFVGSAGGAGAQAVAAKDPGGFAFAAAGKELGSWSIHVFSWVMLTSTFAVLCAVHNMSSRYLLAFGREGLLPAALGRTHRIFKTPVTAGVVQATFTAAVVLVYAIIGADPLLDLVAQMAGVGTLGVVSLMATTALAVIGFFWRRPDRHPWKTVLAPGLACAGLITACVLILENYSLLSGSTSSVVNALPWVLVPVAVTGFVVGSVRPLRRPIDVFADYQSPAA